MDDKICTSLNRDLLLEMHISFVIAEKIKLVSTWFVITGSFASQISSMCCVLHEFSSHDVDYAMVTRLF